MIVLGLYDRAADPDLLVFLNAFQVSFPILQSTRDSYTAYRQSGATSPFPLDYVIDQGGRVAYAGTEYDPDKMAEIIDDLLLNPAPVGDLPVATNPLKLEARPNPFNPRTEIHFEIPQAGSVELDIHDAAGRLVRRLVSGQAFEKGHGVIAWDGTDDQGRSLATGLYLARIRSGGYSAITKLTLLR